MTGSTPSNLQNQSTDEPVTGFFKRGSTKFIDTTDPQHENSTPLQMVAHGQTVSTLLRTWQASPSLQAAGLLHALIWNCVIPVDAVQEACGEQVAYLCQEYQQILRSQPETRWRGKKFVLQRIRYFVAAYRDPEIAFLAAANLWCRFCTADQEKAAQQKIYAEEGRQVLSPFLEMLGMRELREKLEFWLNHLGRCRSKHTDFQSGETGKRVYETIVRQLSEHLPQIHFIQRQRPHSLGSPTTDPLLNTPSFSNTQQILNIEILVNTEEECYRALYWLHNLYSPIEGSLADYIGVSRVNGYRGLQTSVQVLPDGELEDKTTKIQTGTHRVRVNFQICTHQMDEVNRWGLAALSMRKQLSIELPNVWWHDTEQKFRAIESAPLGSLPETLYVFSPHGQIFHFHRGCTVIDYAYHVHSELAAQCRRFYVNGETVEPATVLHHLDLVELEHDPHAPGPTRVWLNAARTSRARTHIDRFLKRQGQGFYHGQKTIDSRLKTLEDHYDFNIPEYRVNQALTQEMQRRNISSREELMTEVSAGRLDADRILHPLFAEEIIRQVQIPSDMRLRPHQLNLAQCCRPRPGDDIIGRPSYRDGIVTKLKIHCVNCAKLAGSGKVATTGNIDLKWRLQPELRAVAQIEMRALDEDGLLGNAVDQLYAMLPRITLHRSEAVARHGVAHIRFTVEAESNDVLDEITDALRRLPNRQVDEVRHISLPFSEREELVRPVQASGVNPYSRMPVHEQEMFFGRSQELNLLRDWLRARVAAIWLLGQKRVGKTSLLLHLKNHFLDQDEFVPVFLDFQILGTLEPVDVFFEIANAVYTELRSDSRIDELGAPLREMFDHDPLGHLVEYLLGVQSHPNVGKVVLLLDEFSRTTDAYLQGRLDESFFQRWRGLIQATLPDVKYIIVIQQQAFDSMVERVQGGQEDPSWHLMELGEKVPLRPLQDKDARHLIEWPIRNYLEFPPDALELVYTLTGGSPFLIQAFCFKLVAHLSGMNKRQVDQMDIEQVCMEFMSPDESLFAHLLDLIRGVANTLCTQMAIVAEDARAEGDRANPVVSRAQLQAVVPSLSPARLQSTLNELCERDILIQVSPDSWRFANLLFQQWLALNSLSA
ncbi:HD domain-containing protein [Chloroflexi bacterium TSY]|nr:HD domain-containing protein [Chloroflexi bacterium TSY]